MEFRPLRRTTALEGAVDAIRRHIIENKLKKGDPIPPETVLAERLGISRNILREALQRFRSSGIIASRPKTGAVIRSLEPENPYSQYMPFLAENGKSLRELAEVRTALEVGAAPFIMAGRTPEKIAELEKLSRKLCSSKNPEIRFKTDMAFHTLLLKFPENSIMESLIPLLVDFFTASRNRTSAKTARPLPEINAEHAAIVKAVRSGSVSKLTKILAHHAQFYI